MKFSLSNVKDFVTATGLKPTATQFVTFNYLVKAAKWLSFVVSTYLYGAFDCMFSSFHVRV